ncbi:uncharacterized protein N7483_000753 [Penicillium malachiteum]|uniref:uncharacterized protein n=1 Tax=Penicillium malachiteum TaxID=1324776 RepID=UPI0025475ACD|nr:uncharacterized protein N7483_000753 [Penicillium malachiteum]KAJ5735628.1 hypothetical protein N7483_000753 [Penicillium malachiteum]
MSGIEEPARSGKPSAASNRPQPMLSLEEQTLEKVAALYWDVNCVCNFQQIVNDAPSKEDYTEYQRMKRNTELFINQTITDYIAALNTGNPTRCVNFIAESSWKIFAICAHSEAFQLASKNADNIGWSALTDLILQNRRSLEVFARSRELEWRGYLLTYYHYNLPALQEELSPDVDIAQEHPHHTVLLADGHLKRPIFEDRAQRTKVMGPCFLCRSRSTCQCYFQPMAGDLVELIDSPNMGTGIRSLGSFKPGDYLAEYAGMLNPVETKSTEAIYALSLAAPNDVTGAMDTKAHVLPHQYGNWTRYINHSCEPAPPKAEKPQHRTGYGNWQWEIIAVTVSLAGFALLVGFLVKVNNASYTSWQYTASPNTIISIITTVVKSALLVPVSACLSQLKWNQ